MYSFLLYLNSCSHPFSLWVREMLIIVLIKILFHLSGSTDTELLLSSYFVNSLFSSFHVEVNDSDSPTHLFFCRFSQTPEELDDSDFETEDFDARSRTSVQTEDDQLIAGQSARVRFRHTYTRTSTTNSHHFSSALSFS